VIETVIGEEIDTRLEAQLVNSEVEDGPDGLQLDVTIRTGQLPRYAEVVALQAAIAGRLQRPVTLQLIVVPITRLDPLVPPTPTGTPPPTFTPTPGPSATITPTASPSTTATRPTPTATASSTPALLATPTPSATSTPTATPALAVIVNTNGQGVAVRAAAGGSIIGFAAEGSLVRVLFQRTAAVDGVWIEVALENELAGSVPACHLAAAP
jgi:hypothetical protein